ncbi:CUB domain [Trinorchestia longiramus]|nr:CUB domain [Trinorchestia longiramus]
MGNLKFLTFLDVFLFYFLAYATVAWTQQDFSWSRREERATRHPDLLDFPASGATRKLIISSTHHSTLDSCGESLVLSRGQSFHFTSPRFPAQYPGFSRCYWAFQTAEPSVTLTLQCDQFHLTPVKLCNKFQDFLLVEEHSTGRAQWFCSGVGPRHLASASMWVTFWSNEHDSRKGFSCHVSADGGADGAVGAGGVLGAAAGQVDGGVAVVGAGPASPAGVPTEHRLPSWPPETTSASRHRCNCGVRNIPNRTPSSQGTRGRPRFPRQDPMNVHARRAWLKDSNIPNVYFGQHMTGNFTQIDLQTSPTLVNEDVSSNGTFLPQPEDTSNQNLRQQTSSTFPLTTSVPSLNHSTANKFEHKLGDDSEGTIFQENLTNSMLSDEFKTSTGEHVASNRVRKLVRNSREDFSIAPSTKIVNGSPVSPHEFPWLVLLEYPHLAGVHCAGSLISSKYVLTAAHCTQYFNGLMTVILGEHDRSTFSDTPYTRRMTARAVTSHPLFNSSTNDNDIAIVMLDSALSLDEVGPYISPICPPNPDDLYEQETTFIVGWGTTSERDQRGSNIPLAAVVRTVGHYECQQQLAETAVTPNMLCARGRGTDTCQNDSGGPLMARYKGSRYVLAGIVSWGIGCARPQYPGVYTRVSNYLQWIKDNTKDSKTCPPVQLRESHGCTTDEYHDDASFHRPMSKQDRRSESSDEARPRYDQKHDITNERSSSGSRAKPTALYNEAATLCVTDSTKRFQSQHLHQKLSSPEQLNSQPAAEQRKQKPAILSADRMGLKQPTH